MPGKLDDFFRKGLQNIPDSTPPPGQWEKIRQRELVVKPVLSGFTASWVVGSLLLGLVIGSSGMWLYTSWYAAADRLVELKPVPVNKAAEEVDFSLLTEPTAVMEEMKPAAEAAGDNEVRMYERQRSSLMNQAAVELKKRSIPTATSQTPEAAIENQELSVSKEIQKVAPETANTALSGSLRTRVRAEKKQVIRRLNTLPVAALPQPDYQMPKSVTKTAATLAGYANSVFILLPKTVSRRPTPASRWEAGLSFAPGLTNSRVTSRVFTEQNNGNAPQLFFFNNQQIELFADDIFDQEVRQQIQLASMSLEGARQFANGTRLGLGVSYSPYSLSGLNNPNDVLAPLLLEGEFATYNWAYEKRFSSFITGGYTFLRRRKVRPYLGLRIGLDFYQEGERKSYLLRGQDGRSEEFLSSRYNSNTGLRELIFNVTAQVGVQYQVHKRISLGVDLLPELAAGMRYRF